MLRKNIGKSKNSNKKQKIHASVLPKSLWKFYIKYAIPGSWGAVIAWAIFFLIAVTDDVIFPNAQRWFVALFETDIPSGMNILQYSIPTIGLIVGLLLMVDSARFMRGMYYGRWVARIRNRASVVLNDYVNTQSMSFWTGRMAGKVHTQIGYVSDGILSLNELWMIDDN